MPNFKAINLFNGYKTTVNICINIISLIFKLHKFKVVSDVKYE